VWCRQQFNRNSFSIIVALLATTAVAALFLLFVFAYRSQLRGAATREPVGGNAYPGSYNRPYEPSYQYPPPNGPPPVITDEHDAFVPPRYGAESADKPPRYGDDFKGDFGDHKDDPFSGGPSV